MVNMVPLNVVIMRPRQQGGRAIAVCGLLVLLLISGVAAVDAAVTDWPIVIPNVAADGEPFQVPPDPAHVWVAGDVFSLHGVDQYRYVVVYTRDTADGLVHGCYEVDQEASGRYVVSQYVHGQEVFGDAFIDEQGGRFLENVPLNEVVITDETPGGNGESYYGQTLGSIYGAANAPSPTTTAEPVPPAAHWPSIAPTQASKPVQVDADRGTDRRGQRDADPRAGPDRAGRRPAVPDADGQPDGGGARRDGADPGGADGNAGPRARGRAGPRADARARGHVSADAGLGQAVRDLAGAVHDRPPRQRGSRARGDGDDRQQGDADGQDVRAGLPALVVVRTVDGLTGHSLFHPRRPGRGAGASGRTRSDRSSGRAVLIAAGVVRTVTPGAGMDRTLSS